MAGSDPTRLHHGAQDLTGRVFGRLTVLRAVGRKRGRVLWLCRCECGKEKEVLSANLLREDRSKIRSCGCLRNSTVEECLRRRVTNWDSGRADICWEWTAGQAGSGYGYTAREGKNILVHRLVYQNYVGPIPDGLCVLHRCDNRLCCNPAHLFLGTHKDNARDMFAKGRARPPKGEACGTAKLTEVQVREIRRRRQAGEAPRALAQEYGVCGWTVHRITRRLSWYHVT